MGKGDDEREGLPASSRMRGLRDIRTLGGLRGSSAARSVLGHGRIGSGLATRVPRRRSDAPVGRPRAWVFIKRPRFSRHQGMLLVDRVAEPDVDVFEEGHALVVLAEMPGASEEDIEVEVKGDVLTLSTRHPERRRYYREILLPFPVSREKVRRAFRNSVLELHLGRAPSPRTKRRSQ